MVVGSTLIREAWHSPVELASRLTNGSPDPNWGANDVSKRRYINQEDLTDAHLIDLNARLYDPLLGKFYSPDPIISDQDDSQSWNAYAYSHNNPMSRKDPSGLEPCGGGSSDSGNGTSMTVCGRRNQEVRLLNGAVTTYGRQHDIALQAFHNPGGAAARYLAQMGLAVRQGQSGSPSPDPNSDDYPDFGGTAGAIAVAAPSGHTPKGLAKKFEHFFGALYGPTLRASGSLHICQICLMGVAAKESGWYSDEHDVSLNNPYGLTDKGRKDLHFGSIDEATEAWVKNEGWRFSDGPAQTVDRFFSDLQKAPGYNTADPYYYLNLRATIQGVNNRLSNWLLEHPSQSQ